ncbi:hypothetical protein E2C01_056981 [Portunus trituberculatus]|uniref:Uncharacterized protein n=1 Tax=Portunus trituberculatus TaxID=210409 RepID=A0A5B7GRT9_PORTR|nr:hypothetical protein [Portunus trituberculatus]
MDVWKRNDGGGVVVDGAALVVKVRRGAPRVVPLPRLCRPLAPVPPTVPPLPRRAHHRRSAAPHLTVTSCLGVRGLIEWCGGGCSGTV